MKSDKKKPFRTARFGYRGHYFWLKEVEFVSTFYDGLWDVYLVGSSQAIRVRRQGLEFECRVREGWWGRLYGQHSRKYKGLSFERTVRRAARDLLHADKIDLSEKRKHEKLTAKVERWMLRNLEEKA